MQDPPGPGRQLRRRAGARDGAGALSLADDADGLAGRIAFIHEAERLKNVLRSAHTSTGRHESTAEHSWRLCLLALTFADLLGPLDLAKVLKLCVVHDLGEAIHGDIPAIDPAARTGDKSARERRDLLQIARTLPPAVRDDLVALWDEYDEATTREARVVKALDKIETILQHHRGANPPGFDHGFNLNYGREYVVGDPVLEALRERVDAATRERIAEAGAAPPVD